MMTDIGYNIKKARTDLNYTQEYVADKSGITQPVLSRIENGYGIPTDDEAKLIANVLNTSVEKLKEAVPPHLYFNNNSIKGNNYGYIHQQNIEKTNNKILEQLTLIANEMKANNDYLRDENRELRHKDEKWMQMISDMQSQLVAFLRDRK